MPRVKREKYPEKAPWDLGPLSEHKSLECLETVVGNYSVKNNDLMKENEELKAREEES